MYSSLALVLLGSESGSIRVQVLDCSCLWSVSCKTLLCCLVSITSNLHSCVLWIPCFPVVIIITDLSMLEEVYTRNILVAGSTFVTCLKYVCI